MCKVYECPACEDRDCELNVEGLCYDINTIFARIPSGMFTCSGAVVDFSRYDYLQYDIKA